MTKRQFETIRLTKRDVAREQLNQSIELFFSHQHPVSANTLAWATLDVLRGMASNRSIATFHDEIESRIKPEHIKDWRSALKRGYNFSKHADRDPNDHLSDFRPEATAYTIMGACFTYFQLFKVNSWSMFVFRVWFMCRYPKVINDSQMKFVEDMESIYDNPADKPFRLSTSAALEIIRTGIHRPELWDALPQHWQALIER